jgi:hypothetical protein
MLWGVVRKRIGIQVFLAACIACAMVAAPWYIRNLIQAHLLMPATVWTNQAASNLSNLLVFITHPENFAFTGWLIIIAIGLALTALVRRPRSADREIFLLIFTLPFFIFWWVLASYDRRFLLYFLPLLTVLAAAYGVRLWERVPQRYQYPVGWVLTLITLGMTVYIASISVDFKTEMLRHPLMSDEAKHQVVTGTLTEP